MSIQRFLCRLPSPAALMASSFILSMSAAAGSRALPSSCYQRAPLMGSSVIRPLYSSSPRPRPFWPLFSRSILSPSFSLAEVGALGSSSRTSSTSVTGTITADDVLQFWYSGVFYSLTWVSQFVKPFAYLSLKQIAIQTYEVIRGS
jgi:hypothetical protein